MVRMAMATALALMCSAVRAEAASVYGMIGGWAYDISGVYTNTSELDLEDDLGLQSTARQNYTLGYQPRAPGWVPRLELDYVRIAADGQQRFTLLPLEGLPAATETVVDDRTNINDFELTAHWPWQRGSFAFLGGLTVTYLNGSITAADENNGQQMTQKISETFPLLSAGVEWRPLPSLRLSLSGDYIRYSGNRADELEARVLWQVLGPVGLEAGYRQRRYKINEPNNRLDAKVAGMRIGLHMAIPL